jgi:hypothetical protein
MNVGTVLEKARFLYAEPSTRRFTDSALLRRTSEAQRELILRLSHPQSQMRIPVVSEMKEYQLPALMKILRVYILTATGAMQELIGTDIPTLEGDIIEMYDNRSGQYQGQPQQTPLWITQPAEGYPITNVNIGGRVPTKSPWGPNQRPSYYLRGGYIGFAIPVMGSGTIVIDYIADPPDLAVSSDTLLVPDICKDALAWYVVRDMLYSDNSSGVQYADGKIEAEIQKLQSEWIFKIQANRPKSLVPTTNRTYFPNRGRGRGF